MASIWPHDREIGFSGQKDRGENNFTIEEISPKNYLISFRF